MRDYYPLISQEINDKILTQYSDLVYLLGFDDGNIVVSGLYDRLECSGVDSFSDMSVGIPHVGNNEIDLGLSYDRTSSSLVLLLETNYKFRRS